MLRKWKIIKEVATLLGKSMTDPLKQMIEEIKANVANKYSKTDYTDSYVAFLDILGMKELVKNPYMNLREIFNAAESGMELYSQIQVSGDNRFISNANLKMNIMSDALVLSIDSKIDNSFSMLIGFSSYLINSLLTNLKKPVFLRGGISRGKIYQGGNTVFGPGLVSAYSLENDVAESMRCIVSPKLHEDTAVQEYLKVQGFALTIDPEDDLYFINFARPELVEQLRVIAIDIIKSDADEKVKGKYRWLSNYISGWNNI